MKIPVWLQIWRYLVDNKPASQNEIFFSMSISELAIRRNLPVLEEIGLINLKRTFKTEITKTQKFYDTLELFMELHDAIELAGKGVKNR